jgi:cytochrome b561
MRDRNEGTAYSPAARRYHWLTAALVFGLLPVGMLMKDRAARDIWDATTNALYSGHKLAGFVLLLVVLLRLGHRLVKGAPPPDPTLPPVLRLAGALTHWSVYALLLIVPMLGWIGISLFPALGIFGLFSLPSITPVDPELSKRILALHGVFAWLLGALVVLHVAAALWHHFIRKDGTLRRMIPARKP